MSSGSHDRSLEALAQADARLRAALGHRGSLCPGRDRATPLVQLGEQLLTARVAVEVGEAFARALVRMVEAQAASFPGNLFWDFELPAMKLLEHAVAEPERVGERMAASAELVVSLQDLFGMRSRIRFRYAHDFLYGFDWERWVKRDPETRSAIGPFGPPFLLYVHQRGRELLELIEQDDGKYGALPDGEVRNPFAFSREPEDEERLHRDLAERGLVPVKAWLFDARPDWRRAYTVLRARRALALGIPPGPGAERAVRASAAGVERSG